MPGEKDLPAQRNVNNQYKDNSRASAQQDKSRYSSREAGLIQMSTAQKDTKKRLYGDAGRINKRGMSEQRESEK